MRVTLNQEVPRDYQPNVFARMLRSITTQLNLLSEGYIAAATNATTAAPTTGTFQKGDFIRNSALAESSAGHIIVGWVCVTAGTPGTWREVRTSSENFGQTMRGLLAGLTLSNNAGDATNDIDIAEGCAMDSTSAYFMRLSSGLTKQLDAVWAVGTNAGMRASGAAIANGTYHVFQIARPDTAVVDIAADTSVTGANIAANTNAAYTKVRRIGAILREGGAIVGFVQDGDLFQRKTSVEDVAATNPGTSAVSRTLSVPTGINVVAGVDIAMSDATPVRAAVLLSDLALTDEVPSDTGPGQARWAVGAAAVGNDVFGRLYVRTNTSGQIRSRVSASDAGLVVRIRTFGWTDTRGRNG